jgi:hypothetical protein
MVGKDLQVPDSFSIDHYKNPNENQNQNPVPSFNPTGNIGDFDKIRDSMNLKIPSFQPGGFNPNSVNPIDPNIPTNPIIPNINPVKGGVDPINPLEPWKPNDSVYDMSRFNESMMIKDSGSDLQCDDHKSQFNEMVLADRYCSRCNLVICNNCVIDNHSDHLKEAKHRIATFLNEHKKECDELNNRVSECMNLAKSKDLKGQALMQEGAINGIFDKRMGFLHNFKSQIDNLMVEENNLRQLAIDNLKSQMNNDLVNKISNRIYEIEDCKSNS